MKDNEAIPTGVREIQSPKSEKTVRRAVEPEADKDDVNRDKESCVDHLCGCKS